MINKYLNYLQEDKEDLNEFVVLPLLIMSLVNKLYKTYLENKKILTNCIGTTGREKTKCFLKHKILALEKTIQEVTKLKSRCKIATSDVARCIKGIDKELKKLNKELQTLHIKLKKL